MIEINPNALYTRADLAAMLEGSGVQVDHFVKRLGPRKVLKTLPLSEDLLQALRCASAHGEIQGEKSWLATVIETGKKVGHD
jgi:hypothetical protein